MAENNIIKRYLDAGMAFTAITQAKAEAIVKDLVKTGELQSEQAQATVTDLLERSRKNTEALIEQIRDEIAASAESLGLATVADLTRIERLIEQIRPGATKKTTAKATPKKATAKKATAKKATAKKATAKKATAKKATAKKATAKKATAKKATAKKATAKKTTAKKTAN